MPLCITLLCESIPCHRVFFERNLRILAELHRSWNNHPAVNDSHEAWSGNYHGLADCDDRHYEEAYHVRDACRGDRRPSRRMEV